MTSFGKTNTITELNSYRLPAVILGGRQFAYLIENGMNVMYHCNVNCDLMF